MSPHLLGQAQAKVAQERKTGMMEERTRYPISGDLSKANLAQLAKGQELHCTQCRRPFPDTAIYKYIHVLLCQACWYELAQAYQDNWPDWTPREYTLNRQGRHE